MDVNSECGRRQPIPQTRVEQDGRRSRDERSWYRPSRVARPHSCIEGRLKDEWLQTFNNLQTCPSQKQLPPYFQKNDTPWSVSPSLVASSLNSLESLHLGQVSKERVQIKTGPSTQRTEVCCLAPVRFGWLPFKSHVVKPEESNNAGQQDGTTCKVKLKMPITPVLRCSSAKANRSDPGGLLHLSHTDRSTGPGVRGVSQAISLQADGKRKATQAQRDQDTALDHAISMQNDSYKGFLWQTPMPRRGSGPQVSLLTAPPVCGRRSPKHNNSISSITITSRKVIRSSSLPDTRISCQDRDSEPDCTNTLYPTEVIPERKALVVKITEQRVATSRFLPPGTNNDPFCSKPSENGFSRFSMRRSSDLGASTISSLKNHPLQSSFNITGSENHIPKISKITNTESHSQIPSCQDTQTPVVLRRKPTIIKVQEQRDTFIRGDQDHRKKMAYRHSFSDPKVSEMKPQLDNERMFSGSDMNDMSNNTKLYKSSKSLQLTSCNAPHLDDSHTSRGSKLQRPASCYARLFSPVESSPKGSQDAIVHSTNITPVSSTASSSNRCWSTERRACSHDEAYPRIDSSITDKGQSKRESALLTNQPLTLIKAPENATHETYDAIVAMNAAAIIANIKLQCTQKKRTQNNGNTTEEWNSTSLNKTAGDHST